MYQTKFWKYIIGIFLIQHCFTAYFKVVSAENGNSAKTDRTNNPSSYLTTDFNDFGNTNSETEQSETHFAKYVKDLGRNNARKKSTEDAKSKGNRHRRSIDTNTCEGFLYPVKTDSTYKAFQQNYCNTFKSFLYEYDITCDKAPFEYSSENIAHKFNSTTCTFRSKSVKDNDSTWDVNTLNFCSCAPKEPSNHNYEGLFQKNITIVNEWAKYMRHVFDCEKDVDCQCKLTRCYKGDKAFAESTLDGTEPEWCTEQMQTEMKFQCRHSDNTDIKESIQCYLLDVPFDFKKDIPCRRNAVFLGLP